MDEARKRSREEIASLADAGRVGDALTKLDALLQTTERLDSDAWTYHAMLHKKLKNYGPALASVDQAVGLNTNNLRAWCYKAIVHWYLGQREKVEGALEETLKINPTYAPALQLKIELKEQIKK